MSPSRCSHCHCCSWACSCARAGGSSSVPSARTSRRPPPPAWGGARQSAVRRAHRAGQGIRHVSGRAELVRGVGLVKRFGGIVANDAVDFVVAEGDLLGLIGPNGSGKTTLINMLTGHLEPDGGDVLVRGQRMSGRPPNVYAAMGVARTFQQTQLFGRMTVLENMLVPGLARSHSTWDDVARRARRCLDFLSVADVDQLPAKNLSGGQQKLLELGRCLMLEPAVLFLDEPFAGVHPRLRDKLLDRIRELHQGGRTFVVVDHDMESILRISRRLVVMARGSKIADGEPDAVRADQAVLAAYAGL